MMINTAFRFLIQKYIYNDPTIFMVYWWGRYSYLNNEHIHISDVELMNASYG